MGCVCPATDLCGHATLATAHVLFEHEGYAGERIVFTQLVAMPLSARKGFLQCRDLGQRVEISGGAKTYMEGRLMI